MARKLSVEFPGAIYHMTHRGNGRMNSFKDDRDREDSREPQDVAFRQQVDALSPDVVLDAVCSVFGVDREYLSRRQRGGMIRPVAAQMLCKYAGMNQRAVAGVLNLKSGGAVSSQLRNLLSVSAVDQTLKRAVEQISEKLDNEHGK
jgi:hypothetical protein